MDLSIPAKGVLFNPEIISSVLEKLELKDVKNIRLVCRKWRKYGWSQLYENPKICVRFENGDKEIEDYIQYFQDTNPKTLPLKNYVLSYEFQSGELLTKFYKIFGSHMRYLDISKYDDIDLDHSDQRNLTSLEHFGFNCLGIDFPILPEIILKGEDTYLKVDLTGSTSDHLTHVRTFLRQNRKGLKRLKFKDEHHNDDEPPHQLSQIIHEAGFVQLKSLQLCGYHDDKCILALASANLPLKKLDIGLTSYSLESFIQLMESINSTLEHLNLYTILGFTFTSSNLVFPYMRMLKSLRIWKFEGSFIKFSHRYLPNLETLHITQMRVKEDNHGADPSDTLLRKCTIYLEAIDHSVEDVGITIANLGKIRTNIQELFIWGKVAEEHQGQIIKTFPTLKKLTLSPECKLSREEHSTYLEEELTREF